MSSSSNSERKALSQLQTKSNKKTIKKSSSLRFNEIEENIEDSAKKAKLSARNSLDNSLFAVHEDDEHGVDKSQLKSSASSFQIYEDNGSKQKQQKDSDTQTKGVSIEIQCEIEEDSTYDQCELTEEELEIKRNNPDNYMKIIAQKIRVELHDQLEENKELYKIKDELKDDQQELLEEKKTLVDLIGEAQGLLDEYQELKGGNDSGIQ